jgi:hypothetical protein
LTRPWESKRYYYFHDPDTHQELVVVRKEHKSKHKHKVNHYNHSNEQNSNGKPTEIEFLTKLTPHPNLPVIVDWYQDGDYYYLVLPRFKMLHELKRGTCLIC